MKSRKGATVAKDNGRLSALDRLVQNAIGDDVAMGSQDDPARKDLPELWKWLATVSVGKDLMKQPATLSIRLGPDCVLVSLVDRDLGVSVEASSSSLQGAFAAMEAALTGSNPPVKSWGKRQPHLRKRKQS